MKWTSQDVEMYSQAKEYIDTALVPLIPIAMGGDMEQSASMTEYISLLASQLERQFTGRLILLPAFTYMESEHTDDVASRLNRWEESLAGEGFKHIFLLTSDENWRLKEEGIGGSLIWMPLLPLAGMEEQQKVMLINGQIKQLMKFFTAKWNQEGN
ncbi:YpiF family protein [Bacillus sp. B-jedd]|uniref:YpiF family protein n=1 Tax=Bacillus sp. B-jedd TaxID=1476857 RepID=UPI0005155FE2|nr:YpiF family protein [Bacillus sp. B-jedd]CEG27646.1 Hypothetical protein BN1002_02517 [Bacillus sp. B-jedd]